MELELLDQILPFFRQNDSVVTGPGDDCAVVKCGDRKLLLAVDQLTENIHFTSDTDPEIAAAKLVKRNLSDIAAMGGTPLWMLLTITNGSRSSEWLKRFAYGAADCADKYNTPVTGGDTSSMPGEGFSASITVIGEAVNPVLRSGAIPGDAIYVTGLIGNSFKSGHHLDFLPQLDEGVFLAKYANSMMDISDGLLLDAERMAKQSHVDFVIDPEKIPLRTGASMPDAMSDGEDYGLLFTAPDDGNFEEEFRKKFPETLLTRIGYVTSGSGNVLNKNSYKTFELKKFGYEH